MSSYGDVGKQLATPVDLNHVHDGEEMLLRHLREQKNVVEKNLTRARDDKRRAEKILEEAVAREHVESALMAMITDQIAKIRER